PCIRQQFSHSLHGFRTLDAICYFLMQKFLSVGLSLRIAVSVSAIVKGYLFNEPGGTRTPK
ncbi:hypothetical protein, partial [Salmonella sp. SAL04292]|uniref:hypothetical protein n=1 Tax=Salmonella sp. SAL04292 TaxID=3159870 RepID=UPI00397DF3A7